MSTYKKNQKTQSFQQERKCHFFKTIKQFFYLNYYTIIINYEYYY